MPPFMPPEFYVQVDIIRPTMGLEPVATTSAIVSTGKCAIEDLTVDVVAGDVLRRRLPNGNLEYQSVQSVTVAEHPELGHMELAIKPCAPPRAPSTAAPPRTGFDMWSTRDLPVLRAVLRLVEADPSSPDTTPAAIAAVTNLPEERVQVSLRALEDGRLIGAVQRTADGDAWLIGKVTGDGRKRAGAWPDPETATRALIEVLERIAEDESRSGEDRGVARRILEAITSGAGQVGTSLITTALARVLGLG